MTLFVFFPVDQTLTCYFGYYKNPKNSNKFLNNSQFIFYYFCK
jgi:hypothetical protein